MEAVPCTFGPHQRNNVFFGGNSSPFKTSFHQFHIFLEDGFQFGSPLCYLYLQHLPSHLFLIDLGLYFLHFLAQFLAEIPKAIKLHRNLLARQHLGADLFFLSNLPQVVCPLIVHLLCDTFHGHVVELQHQTLLPFRVIHFALERVHVTTQLADSLVALGQISEKGSRQGGERVLDWGFGHLIYQLFFINSGTDNITVGYQCVLKYMISPAATKVPTRSTPSTMKNLYFRQHMAFYSQPEFFSNAFAQSRIKRELPFMSVALSFMSQRASLFPMSFLTPKLSSPLSSLTAFCASLTLSTHASLYFSQTAVNSLLRPLIFLQLSSSLGCLSWMMACNFCRRPYANLSGQSSLTHAADRSVSVVLITYQFPNSPFNLSRSPTRPFRNLALLAISFPSSFRPFLVLGARQVKRKAELLQCARRTAVRLIFKIIENLWMYNVICKLEALMDHHPNHNNNNPHPRRPTFLSEYESHESESHSGRGRHIRSGRIMRKLKQLWLRQRYLTDDEVESGREGHFDTERQSGQGLWEKPMARPSAEGGEEKRFHPRQVSSQQEQLNIIRKKSNKHSAQSQEPSKQSRDMEQLEQIAAFNSQVQNESK